MSEQATDETLSKRRHPSARIVRWTCAVIAGALIGSTVSGVPTGLIPQWAYWHISHTALSGTPTCGDTSYLAADRISNADAFNELPSRGGNTYDAGNTVDSNRDTAWLQHFPSRNRHAWITWTLEQPKHVSLVCIRAGYTKNYGTYTSNERLRTVTLHAAGCASRVFIIKDYFDAPKKYLRPPWDDWQSLPYSCHTSRVELTIDATYPADGQSSDTGVSDVAIFSSPFL
jgi:hypothetical protein